jgi:hypothetical protein
MIVMTYDQVFQVLSLYCPGALPLFADRWGRWPTEGRAAEILEMLRAKQAFWQAIGPNVAASIGEAIETIEKRKTT